MKALVTRRLATFLSRFEGSEALRRCWIWLSQLTIFAASGFAAFLLRFDFNIPRIVFPHLQFAIAIWLIVKSASFRLFGLHRGWWKYVSVPDVLRIGLANLVGSAVSGIGIRLLAPPGFPRSIYFLDLLLCFLGTAGIRLAARMLAEAGAQLNQVEGGKRILIYGAGTAGQALLREIRFNAQLRYEVCGFVDDDLTKKDGSIVGVRVLGPGTELPRLVRKLGVNEVMIAMPSATGRQMLTMLGYCRAAGVACKTIPAVADLVEGNTLARQIRDVAVEDLLGRTPVHIDESRIRGTVEGKVVMVTGAAGSIGSELCRQIARFNPAGIVGFEIAESPLFEIDREMRQAFPQTPFFPEIGSIQNRARLHEVLRRYSPSVVYHAAAYKHVPLMEAHVFEAIENNVFGTYNVATAAAEHGVGHFVMISSDKAVRPTNVMGATKRVAELLILALQNGHTRCVAVRFGNVLGSNGSVIPIFKKQIAAGGPVTVTHPEMRRFFMTIPEACQLVLQAAVIGDAGQICILDMGEPVKILDLARNLILLSGLSPDEDIKIEFTGVRPGEKLYEELTTLLEDTAPTTHEKIRIFTGDGMPESDMLDRLNCLREICEARDASRLIVTLKEIVHDYSPSTDLLKRVLS